jgi:hypothetical protein
VLHQDGFMSTDIQTEKIADEITKLLDIKGKNLASLLGVTATTLSSNLKKPFSEVRSNRFGKRMLALLYVVEALSKDKTLTPKVMLHVLTTPRYKMGDGTYLDVISGIHLGNIQNEFLVTIADAVIENMREKYKKDKAPARESIYFEAISG